MSVYDPSAQRLFVGDTLNLRELGGMPLKGGKTFRKGVFLRSGSPVDATDKGRRLIKEYGVNTVIDLRSSAELKRFGNPFEHDKDVNFYNIPLFTGDPDALDKDAMMNYLRTHKLGHYYISVLKDYKDELADVLRILTNNTDGVCLFHCAHGKDRTGIITALLYLLAGATREDIVLNYKVSYEYAAYLLDPLIEKREDELKHTLRSDAENMVILLDWLDKDYKGDIVSFLLDTGLTEDDINTLRDRIIE